MARVQIGWLNLSEDKVFTDRGYECAAWWKNVAVKAGKYPMFIDSKDIWDDGRVYGNARPTTELSGTIVSDYFGSMLCGVPVGTYDGNRNNGKEASYFWSDYAFSFAEWVATKKVSDGISMELLDGFRVNVGTRYSTVYEKDVPTYDLYKEVQ